MDSRDPKGLAIMIFTAAVWIGFGLCPMRASARQAERGATNAAPQGKTLAQTLVDDAFAKHHELTGLEVSATPPAKRACVTIAATEVKGLGEKCDEDEFTAMRTGKPFVEKERDGWDITTPLHDASGRMIGALGIDFKREPGQQESGVVARARQITNEIEKQIPSKAKLFEPAD
jgi:hypothetical protein